MSKMSANLQLSRKGSRLATPVAVRECQEREVRKERRGKRRARRRWFVSRAASVSSRPLASSSE
jgi:hypothetical protein